MAGEISCEDKSIINHNNMATNTNSSTGFGYSNHDNPSIDHQAGEFRNPIQYQSEIFNLTTGMENMIGFSKNLHRPSSSKTRIDESTAQDFYHHDHDHNQNLMVGPNNWQENRFPLVDEEEDDSSSLRCVFPCEGNERPSQGLSLSLSSANPSSIGLQFFELRQTSSTNHHQPHQQVLTREGFFEQQSQLLLKNSKYLIPAQELLNEFCSLGLKQNSSHKNKQQMDQSEDLLNPSSSSRKQPLFSLDFIELQKRRTKLYTMLEELERRYRHYSDQMMAVVSSFEAVAGLGTARVYTSLASKAMSRHFKCLKDGIVNQIQAIKKAMGEKDPVAPGASRGETPRLRVLDQALRQQRAFQQMTLMETHPWRPQRGLPERSVSILRAWLFEHFLHPYPSDVDKHILARQTGLSRSQVSNWFINARVRLWKPMVEEMYMEEVKEQEQDNMTIINNMISSDGVLSDLGLNENPTQTHPEDQKPTTDQLLRIDSECLSSIITNNRPDKNITHDYSKTTSNKFYNFQPHHDQHLNFGRVGEGFGSMELDFYSAAAATSGSGVSLTLGLQQHGGHGVSLGAIASPVNSQSSSLFYARDQMDQDCQQVVQYSLLDGDQTVQNNLPYRNLMGAQLLHDLA